MADLIPGTSIPIPKDRTPFDKVLPFDRIFQENLINQLAYSQVAPDIYRAQRDELNNLGRAMALSGAYRTGHAPREIQNTRDRYGRSVKEGQAQFTGTVKDWLTDWYNRQAQAYYKNAAGWKMPTLPTFDEYAEELGFDPNLGTQVDPQLEALKNSGWNPTGGYTNPKAPPRRTEPVPMPTIRKGRPGFGGRRLLPIFGDRFKPGTPWKDTIKGRLGEWNQGDKSLQPIWGGQQSIRDRLKNQFNVGGSGRSLMPILSSAYR